MLRRQVFFAVASHRIQRLTWTFSATDILTEPVDFHFYNKIVLYCFSLALNKKSFSTTTIMWRAVRRWFFFSLALLSTSDSTVTFDHRFFFYVLLDDVLLVASTPPQISVDERSSYIICSPSQLIYTCELIQFNREIETTELLISIRHIYWLFHLPPYVTEQPQKYCYQCVLLGDEFHSSLIRTPVHGSWVWHEKKKKKKRNYQAIMSTLAVGPQVKWILKESWIRSPVIGDGLWNPLKSLL